MAFKLATLSVAAGIASGVVSALLLSWVSRPRDAEAHRVYVNGSAAIVRGNGSGSNTPPRLNPAEEERAHAEALRAHDLEPIDPKWSEEATAAYAADLDKAAKTLGFRVLGVDCRQRSCASTLRWESYDAARNGQLPLLKMHRTVNCAIRLFTPPPSDPKAPYEARVLFPSCVGRE
jgi:hypothetical protein